MMAPTVIFAVLSLVAVVIARAPQKIVNGREAALGALPYQVSLRVRGQHFCGGAIVSPRDIVTAAHCVIGLNDPLTVVVGTVTSFDGEVHTPTEIVRHPQFQLGGGLSPFDIAVIKLGEDIVFNTFQNKIALATAPAPVNVMATASGWGYIRASLPLVTQFLNEIQLETIPIEQCKQMFGSSGRIYANQICTYSGHGFGICKGDSGGPLVYNNELIGIVSYGRPCAVGFPDVYTSVYHLAPWVNSIINA